MKKTQKEEKARNEKNKQNKGKESGKKKENSEVSFNVDNLQILSADGALLQVDPEGCKMLFYCHTPLLNFKQGSDIERPAIVNKALVEVRLPFHSFLRLSDFICDEIAAVQFENIRKISKEHTKNSTDAMFV